MLPDWSACSICAVDCCHFLNHCLIMILPCSKPLIILFYWNISIKAILRLVQTAHNFSLLPQNLFFIFFFLCVTPYPPFLSKLLSQYFMHSMLQAQETRHDPWIYQELFLLSVRSFFSFSKCLNHFHPWSPRLYVNFSITLNPFCLNYLSCLGLHCIFCFSFCCVEWNLQESDIKLVWHACEVKWLS